MKIHIIAIIAIFTILLVGCGGEIIPTTGSLVVDSVTPNSSLSETSTTFTIAVTYTLANAKDTYIDVAFNDDDTDESYHVRQTVPASNGTHSISISAVSTPLDRTDSEDFGVFVILSEKSGSSWDVIDSELNTLALAP